MIQLEIPYIIRSREHYGQRLSLLGPLAHEELFFVLETMLFRLYRKLKLENEKIMTLEIGIEML